MARKRIFKLSDRFLTCLPLTLRQEGGNSNDPHDPGGRTHEGIIQREYDRYRQSKNLLLQSVYLASDIEVQDIYLNSYWLPHCPDLPAGLDMAFFDQCVNEGPREATLLLQRALGIGADGMFGPNTLTAVRSITDIKTVIVKYSDARRAFYRSLRTFQYFGTDWIRRTNEIQAESIVMIQ